jgi:hypothetical protein
MWGRLLAEFLVIVLGVLVALGVDDWRQASADKELGEHLVARIAQDLDEDLGELERVTLRAQRRIWLTDAVLWDLEGEAGSLATSFPEGTADAVGDCIPTCDPYSPEFSPLSVLGMFTQFDLTDGTYREVLSTGSLRVFQDLQLRAELAAYYNLATEGAAGDERSGRFHEQFLDEIQEAGLTTSDEIMLGELIATLKGYPRMSVTLRRLRSTILNQLFNYERVASAARELRSKLQ